MSNMSKFKLASAALGNISGWAREKMAGQYGRNQTQGPESSSSDYEPQSSHNARDVGSDPMPHSFSGDRDPGHSVSRGALGHDEEPNSTGPHGLYLGKMGGDVDPHSSDHEYDKESLHPAAHEDLAMASDANSLGGSNAHNMDRDRFAVGGRAISRGVEDPMDHIGSDPHEFKEYMMPRHQSTAGRPQAMAHAEKQDDGLMGQFRKGKRR
jgi:hypothetical protein